MSTPEVLTTWKYNNSGFARYITVRCDGPSHCIFKPISGPASAKASTRSGNPEPLERFIETVVSTSPVPKPLYSLVLAIAIQVPSGERDSADQATESLHPKQVKSTTAIRSCFIGSPSNDIVPTAGYRYKFLAGELYLSHKVPCIAALYNPPRHSRVSRDHHSHGLVFGFERLRTEMSMPAYLTASK